MPSAKQELIGEKLTEILKKRIIQSMIKECGVMRILSMNLEKVR